MNGIASFWVPVLAPPPRASSAHLPSAVVMPMMIGEPLRNAVAVFKNTSHNRTRLVDGAFTTHSWMLISACAPCVSLPVTLNPYLPVVA
ncbi:hypothetical protein [Bifidobacterium sp. SO1]|uniref:hypothetical protein n=1 Tax=Bifidobacterium sp. SO1 TaxID=2809029 RepID=UPI001BDC224B|nr:hypothetical protein [Bifidobacterium sp. SO1]MBT1161199.1 hypothetical protein [Bifidobacterium sp. SO1]